MANRHREEQSKHDHRVREIAEQLKQAGRDVQADVPGFLRPGPIGKGGHIPDVVATKAGAERIIEVERSTTMEAHKAQHQAFRRRVSQKNKATLRIEETPEE